MSNKNILDYVGDDGEFLYPIDAVLDQTETGNQLDLSLWENTSQMSRNERIAAVYKPDLSDDGDLLYSYAFQEVSFLVGCVLGGAILYYGLFAFVVLVIF